MRQGRPAGVGDPGPHLGSAPELLLEARPVPGPVDGKGALHGSPAQLHHLDFLISSRGAWD